MATAVVARHEERARLRGVLDGAAAGAVRAAVVEGVGGIGKSTLLAELAVEAGVRGFTVVGARAEELERGRAFGPLAAAFRRCGAGALADRLSGGGEFTAVDAVLEWVEKRAVDAPVLVWLDDLQWADPWTARTAAILARRVESLPVAIAVALRPLPREDEVAAAVRSLGEAGAHLRLAPMTGEEVGEIVAARAGAAAGERLREYMDRAGGNPLFVAELYDALEQEHGLVRAGGVVEVRATATPPSFLVTIMRRLSGHSSEELDVLRTVAVFGGTFTVADVALAHGVEVDTVAGPLAALRADGIVVDDTDGRLRLRHDVIREGIYDDIGAAGRAAIHRRAGRAFACAGRTVDAAYHLLRADAVGDRVAADALVDAARASGVDTREVAAYLEEALRIDPQRADSRTLRTTAAGAMAGTDRPGDAIPLLEPVLAATTDPAERLTLMGILGVAAMRANRRDEARRYRQEAGRLADQLAGSDDPDVLLGVSQTRFDRGDFAGAAAISLRAAELAAAAGNGPAEEEGHSSAGWLLCGCARPHDALPHAVRAVELGRGRRSESMRRFHHAQALGEVGDVDGAAAELEQAAALADRYGQVAMVLKVALEQAWGSLRRGDLDAVDLHADTALALMSQYDMVADGAHPTLAKAWARWHRAEGDPLALAASVPDSAYDRAIHLTWMELRSAAAPSPELAARALEAHGRPYFKNSAGRLTDIARAAVACGDDELAQQVLSRAEEGAAGATAASALLAALRCQALVSRSIEAGEEVVVIAESHPWPFERAGALEDAAIVLSARRVELLTAAAALYEAVGAARDVERVQPALGRGRAAPRRARPVSGWDALTAAERDVVALVVEGLTNRQIGERLFVSHHTVATHLSHAFDKLGIRSRVELAREAARRMASP